MKRNSSSPFFRKLGKIAGVVLAVTMLLSSLSFGTSAAITESGGTDSSKVTLDVETKAFNVTVPTILPIWVDSDNNVTVADNAQIINNTTGQVKVTNVGVEGQNGWSIVPFDTDFKKVPVDTKQYGMTLMNDDVVDGVSVDRFDIIDGNSAIPVVYNGNVAIQSDSIKDLDIGHIVFTVAWNNNKSTSITLGRNQTPLMTKRLATTSDTVAKNINISHSLALDGTIGLVFYVTGNVDAESSKVVLEWDYSVGQTSPTDTHHIKEYNISELTSTPILETRPDPDGRQAYVSSSKAWAISSDCYAFEVFTNIRESVNEITLNLYEGNSVIGSDTYSVTRYANDVIANENGDMDIKLFGNANNASDRLAKLQDLCRALLTYASNAQKQFGYKTDSLADQRLVDGDLGRYILPDIDVDSLASYDHSQKIAGMDYYGSSMLLESSIVYSIWYRHFGSYPNVVSTTIDGVEMDYDTVPYPGGGYVTYNCRNIPASSLLKDITFEFTTGETAVFNMQEYIKLVLTASQDEKLHSLVKSIYDYAQKADAFFD